MTSLCGGGGTATVVRAWLTEAQTPIPVKKPGNATCDVAWWMTLADTLRSSSTEVAAIPNAAVGPTSRMLFPATVPVAAKVRKIPNGESGLSFGIILINPTVLSSTTAFAALPAAMPNLGALSGRS